jgi:5-methylthioadenosine/S-adenosylhomocysteine deaminase
MNYVLHGRVVTMNGAAAPIASGAVYVTGNTVTAVAERTAPPPAGFAKAIAIETAGTIFPGLIELHNHLSYDCLPMWQVPQKFTNRGQWQNNADYAVHVSAAMGQIAKSKDANVLAGLARYAETKCLLGGVTSSQGISLKGGNLDTYYRSAMRVVDDPGDPAFTRAATHIPDIDASDWKSFKAELGKVDCLLLHLSEGLDAAARNAFLALEEKGVWAITSALAGIHCAALQPKDFAIMKEKGASVVWSPLSNLMLYGGTTDIKSARAAGLDIALGSDWSPSGSKNLLNELKVAHVTNQELGLGLTNQDIVAMVTSTAARIIKWDALVGSIAAGKRADFTVIAGKSSADPYLSLIEAAESDLHLTVIDGQPVVGTTAIMAAFNQSGEAVKLGSTTRVINYGAGDPRVPKLTFAQAQASMKDALGRLPTLLADEAKGHGVMSHALTNATSPAKLHLALDEEHDSGFAQRLTLPLHGKPTGPDAAATPAAKAPVVLIPLTLDPVAVADDAQYGKRLQGQMNIPPAIKTALKAYY